MRQASLVACLLCALHGAASSDPHDLDSLAVPGGTTAAMRVTGDTRETGHAAFAYDIVRRFYNQPADATRTQDPTLRRLLAHIAEQRRAPRSAHTGTHDLQAVPSPLPPSRWREVLGLSAAAPLAPDIGHVLASHDAALLYAALLRMPATSRAWLATRPGLLPTLLPHAAALVIVAPVLDRQPSGWRLPGGDDARPIWERLAGQRLDDPRFLEALLTREGGWLAVMADVLGGLSHEQQRVALGLTPSPADPSEPTRLLRAIRQASGEWVPRQRPFWRPTLDPALLLLQLPATSDGLTLPGTVAQWSAILAGRRLPDDAPTLPTTRAQRPTPSWLVAQVFTGSSLRRRTAYDQVLRAQRLAASGSPHLDHATAGVVQALATYPQLVLTLERMGIRRIDLQARVVALVQRLEREGRMAATRQPGGLTAAAALDPRLVQLQAGLMVLVQARANGTLDDTAAHRHVETLLAAVAADTADARVVGWLVSLAGEAAAPSAAVSERFDEAIVRVAAGRAIPHPVTWEGTSYRIDPGAAAVDRLRRLRGMSGGRFIDGAADLAAHVRSAGADRARLRAWLDDHGRLVDPSLTGTDVWSGLAAAWRQAAAVPTAPALLTVASHLATLGLVELNYALAMGTGDELPLRPLDAARRHVFVPPTAAAGPWNAPAVVVDEGTRWHVRGSLLGIDVALAPLALRRATTRLPPRRPTLNTADRRVFIESVPLVRRGALPPALAADVHAVANAGRVRLREATAHPEGCLRLVEALEPGSFRSSLLRWQCVQRASDLVGHLSMRDLLALGEAAPGGRLRVLDGSPGAGGFGATAQPLNGAWTVRVPLPLESERITGHWGTGVSAAAFPDLHLRVLELLGALELPAVLLPEVLASVTWEFVTRVPAAYPDDWSALNEMVWRIDAEAVERALALQTGAGVLRVLE